MPCSPPTHASLQRDNGRLLSQNFTCFLCHNNFISTGIDCSAQRLCGDCFTEKIVPLFERGLMDDHHRPIKFLGQSLQPGMFSHTIDFPFRILIQWSERENMRRQPMTIKLYCKNDRRGDTCGNFIGLKTRYVDMVGCRSCNGVICSRCGHVVVVDRVRQAHKCDTGDDFAEEPRDVVVDSKYTYGEGELGAMFEQERDPADAGVLTNKERKARLWKWLEEVEEPRSVGRLP